MKSEYLFLKRIFLALAWLILSAQIFSDLDKAWAQAIPPAGESGVQEKSLRQSRPEFQPPPEQIPDIQIDDSRTIKDAGEGPSFFVRKVVVEGNTVLGDEILEPIVDIGEGMDITLGILALMAQEITARYAREGYILSQAYISEQEVLDGVVTIQILEGRAGEVRVTGNERFAAEDILSWMAPVREKKIFEIKTLEKSLLLLNEVMGFNAKATLKPGGEFGTSDILLDVTESRPYRFSFDGDNFGSRFTGEQRYGITGVWGSALLFGDRLSFRGVHSNDDQYFLNPAYTIPLNNRGTSLTLSHVFSDFNLGENLAVLNAGGKANITSLQLNHPIYKTRASALNVTLGGELRYFENDLLGQPSSDDKFQDIYVAFAGFFSDSLKGRTFYNFQLQQGFGETDLTDPLNSRSQGRGDVFIIKMEAQRFQSAYFLNSYFIFKGRGQIAGKRVLSPDLFPIGGFGSVRGYPLAEAAGDNGYTFSIEYVLPFPFKISLSDKPRMKRLDQVVSLFGFFDHGEVFVKNKQPGEYDIDLDGAGGGVRVNIPQWGPNYPSMSFSASVGFPLEGAEPSDGSSHTLYLGGVITY